MPDHGRKKFLKRKLYSAAKCQEVCVILCYGKDDKNKESVYTAEKGYCHRKQDEKDNGREMAWLCLVATSI